MATDEELKRALKAFKKRFKLTRLDDESGLSRGGGKKSGITGHHAPDRTSTRNLGRARQSGQAQTRDGQYVLAGRRRVKADRPARRV